ncbi:MAG: dihydrofolate reductase family protein, partial [Ancrocorticia sp.]
WDSPDLNYAGTKAHVLEVLTDKASNSYKAFLRGLGISYIIAGERELDYQLAMSKLKNLFHIELLMLGGGGVLNWSFIQAGMCDELSIVIAAAVDGASDSPSVFEARNLTSDDPRSFTLETVEVKEGGAVWLRYMVKNQ